MQDNQHPATAASRDNQHPAIAAGEEEARLKWNSLLFDIRRSIRYHSKRADFFGFLTKSLTAISMILGSGVVASVFYKNEILSVVFGLVVAIFSAISLAFGHSSKELLHSELKRKFINLERDMVKHDNIDDKALKEKTAERLSIEADEPAVVRTLDVVCHNELVKAQGYGQMGELNWIRSLLRQIDLPGFNPKLKAAR